MVEADRGKLIAIYGVNEETVSVQTDILTDEIRLRKPWMFVHPINYFEKNPNDLPLRIINHRHTLNNMLDNGMNVIVNNYIGKSFALNRAAGIPTTDLERVLDSLVKPDVSILIDESDADVRIREAFLFVAADYGWRILRGDDNELDKARWEIIGKVL